MSKVFVRRSSYDYSKLKPAVDEILDSLTADVPLKGKNVLIKPNLLAPAKPEQAIITHPLVIRAVVEYVLGKGGKPVVSDSNAIRSFEKIISQGGIREALKGLDVVIKSFVDSTKVKVDDPVIKELELATEALNADVVINLPKLKTHSQMLMTMGIKNLFGCVVGLKKPEWHLRLGIDRELFARLLVLIYKAVNPDVTLLDGVLAMEGDGPGTGGTPRELGVLIGSRNAAALDITVCRMLAIKPEEVLTNKIAMSMGLVGKVEIDGAMPDVKGFKLPDVTHLVFGPGFSMGMVRRHFIRRPVSDKGICRLCGECWKYCPVNAIQPEGKKVKFDYEKCIRCYCCLEVCPHGALKTKEPLAGRLARKLRRHIVTD